MPLDKNTILKNAQKYTARGQLDKAIEEWQKLIQESPNDGNIYNTIGDLYLRNNSIQEAVSAYIKAGDSFYKAGFALKTIALYKKVNKIDPENIEVYLKLAALNAERGLIGNARDDYLKAARLYQKQGQSKQAVAVYKKIADLEPDNISVHQRIAEMCLKEGLKKDAADEYNKIAEVYVKNNDVKEAESFFNQALSIDPDNRKAAFGIGNLRLKQDKLQDGINILEGILEKRPDDVKTLNLFIDACTKSGDYAKAEKGLRHMITLEPADPAHHERLGYVFLRKGAFGNAISEFKIIIDDYAQKHEFDKIKKIVQDILEADNKNIDARTMLIDVYEKTGNEGGKIAEYLSIADIYLEQTDLEKAANVYREVLKIDPNNIEAKKRLDEISARERPQEKAPEKEAQLEATVKPEKVIQPEVKAEIKPEIKPQIKPEIKEAPSVMQAFAAVEEQAISDEDAEKIDGYYTEADVYLKYGLTNKSIEQLELILAIKPSELKARKKLKDIYKIEGNTSKAVEECIVISMLHHEKGDIKKAEEVLKEAIELDPDNERVRNRLGELGGAPLIKQSEMPRKEAEAERGIPTVELTDFDLEGIASIVSPEKPEEVEHVHAEEIEEAVAEIPIVESFEPVEEIQPVISEAPQVEKGAEFPPVSLENIQEFIAEADFYSQQGLAPEAQGIYERILAIQPDNQEVKERLAKLLNITKPDKKAAPIKEKKEDVGIEVKKGGASFKILEKEDEAEEGNFFDLSEELKEEMAAAPAASESKELKDMELSDIFHEFKKGVKEYLGDEDHETHYNLGIAYREMGLINEAIGEFQLAIKGSERFFDASSMLALCFKEKGMHQLAVTQLKRAIDDPRYNESEFLSLKYDLGLIYEEMGLMEEAYKAFIDVYGTDVNFRDVAEKIDKLKGSQASKKKIMEDIKPVEKRAATEKIVSKIIDEKPEEPEPIVVKDVEAAASAKKNKKGKVSYI
ncbi:MAG: tetratricopeptide repeat protein [Nitrospirae bacterium]|nr:tetratricopeptide repeat protein [Nitrospirota bacterium]